MRMEFIRRCTQRFLRIEEKEEIVSVVPIGIPSPQPTILPDRARKDLGEMTVFHGDDRQPPVSPEISRAIGEG